MSSHHLDDMSFVQPKAKYVSLWTFIITGCILFRIFESSYEGPDRVYMNKTDVLTLPGR